MLSRIKETEATVVVILIRPKIVRDEINIDRNALLNGRYGLSFSNEIEFKLYSNFTCLD